MVTSWTGKKSGMFFMNGVSIIFVMGCIFYSSCKWNLLLWRLFYSNISLFLTLPSYDSQDPTVSSDDLTPTPSRENTSPLPRRPRQWTSWTAPFLIPDDWLSYNLRNKRMNQLEESKKNIYIYFGSVRHQCSVRSFLLKLGLMRREECCCFIASTLHMSISISLSFALPLQKCFVGKYWFRSLH